MARPGLDKHVKFRRLVRILQEPEPHVRGYLELVWEVGYENGDPVLGDEEAVEAAAKYPGEPGKLFQALMACGGKDRAGFIEQVPDEPGLFQIHDLYDHAPEYVASRAAREAERRKPKQCEHCGAGFRSSDTRAKYCSDRCRKAAWRHSQAPDDISPRQSETERDGPGRGHLSRETDRDGQRQSETESDGTPAPAPAPAPKEERVSAGADGPSQDLQQERDLIAKWNNLPGVVANRGDTFTEKRRRMFRARLKSTTWLEEATTAMDKFPLQCQLDGRGDVRSDAWKPNLEWFLAPDSVTNILEGKYDFSKANGNEARNDSPARIR